MTPSIVCVKAGHLGRDFVDFIVVEEMQFMFIARPEEDGKKPGHIGRHSCINSVVNKAAYDSCCSKFSMKTISRSLAS